MSSHICQIIALPKEMLEEFKIETNVMCSLCSKVVKHKSALKIHMRKKHRVELDEECLLKQHPSLKTIPITKKAKRLEMCSCKFYCPIATCRYNISNQVKSKKLFSFPSFHSLKHHYNLNHMTKKYICTRCNKGYSIHSDLLSHTKLK